MAAVAPSRSRPSSVDAPEAPVLARSASKRSKLTAEEREQRREELKKLETTANKKSQNYNMTHPFEIMFQINGTFWPLVVKRYEIYLYPGIHLGLVLYAHFEGDAGYDDGDFWGAPSNMLPWGALGLLTSLMIFLLVFFLSQCYSRFIGFFTTCISIETSVHELTMIVLTHMTDATARWDAVRYLTASGVIIYSRVTKLAEHKEASVEAPEWDRMMRDEQDWLGLETDSWEKMMGWPRTREQAARFASALATHLGLSPEQPVRHASCPPLLTASEIDELRRYPGGYFSFVLQTWTLQVLKDHEDELKGPFAGAAQAAIFKLRAATYGLRAQVRLSSLPLISPSLALISNLPPLL